MTGDRYGEPGGAPDSSGTAVDLIIPTSGRLSLYRLLSGLAESQNAGSFGRIVVVDDREDRGRPLIPGEPPPLADRMSVVACPARGPAAARNTGWRLSGAEWVLFLDDDVVPSPGWAADLVRDLGAAGPDAGGSQGRIRMPLTPDRKPTDWERDVAGLVGSRWITADMAYRRDVLLKLGGFDERFPRADRAAGDLEKVKEEFLLSLRPESL